jgi:UDP-N-acetylmuramate dehydrogenase
MKYIPQATLKHLNTFGLDASAGALVEIETEEDLLGLPAFDRHRDLVLGGGSNVVLLSDVPGMVYLNRIRGMAVVEESGDTVLVEAAAGEDWHGLVQWTLDRELNGLENLSFIPGSVGAAPIQNIGAYGVELASVLESVSAWDWNSSRWVTMDRDACRLAYRDSLFRSVEPDRYLVTSIRLALSRTFQPQTGYGGLQEELGMQRGHSLNARDVSEAVIRLRRRKLPDPHEHGNAGSFFKNPIVEAEFAENLRSRHHGIPTWPQPDGRIKFPAAWMIESCGLKGRVEGGARVSEQHALVLVNDGSASGHDLSTLAIEVQKAVFETFGVRLEPEPRLIEFPM